MSKQRHTGGYQPSGGGDLGDLKPPAGGTAAVRPRTEFSIDMGGVIDPGDADRLHEMVGMIAGREWPLGRDSVPLWLGDRLRQAADENGLEVTDVSPHPGGGYAVAYAPRAFTISFNIELSEDSPDEPDPERRD